MLHIAFVLLAQIFISDHDAGALARTAPEPIATADAKENILAARVAGVAYDVDPMITLSISAHESRYQARAVGPESGGMVSCGSMTPTPVASCPPGASVLDGYLAGAKHLREWIDAMHGDVRAALVGYAGGYRLIAACALGPVIIRPNVDACTTPEVFRWRAAWIAREMRSPEPSA